MSLVRCLRTSLAKKKFVKRLDRKGDKKISIPKPTSLLNEISAITHFREATHDTVTTCQMEAQPDVAFPPLITDPVQMY